MSPSLNTAMPVEEVAASLGTDMRTGLSAGEAASRLAKYGPNQLKAGQAQAPWKRFLAHFKNALVLLLLAAAIISLAVWILERNTNLPYEALVIIAIVLLNAILGFVQEERAEQAIAALRAMAAPEASVVRDGEQRRIDTHDLVPGDLLVIEEGDTISADARLIEVVQLRTQEASLTGESMPVAKKLQAVADTAPLGDRVNMVFAGTTAVHGHARAIVTSTGMLTEMGRIAGLLNTTESPATPLQKELDQTGKQLGVAVVVIAAVVIATLVLLNGVRDASGLVHILMFGVALAVAAAPEGLAAIVTVVLAMGVQRMAARGAIVRKLPAVETLGSATLIASDKTGTLTHNEMTVRLLATASGRSTLTGTGYDPEGDLQSEDGNPVPANRLAEAVQLLQAAVLANNAILKEKDGVWTILGDPTEAALLVAAKKAKLDLDSVRTSFPRLEEIPFSSERKRMSTLNQKADSPEARFVFIKGAAGVLLDRCDFEQVGEKIQPLDPERRTAILKSNEYLASEALRTLGIAFRSMEQSEFAAMKAQDSDAVESKLVFLGILGMTDPPRPEARPAVEKARLAGMRTILITGDHPATGLAIGREVGITDNDRVIDGVKIDAMPDQELATALKEISIFARVNPQHKLRLMKVLQSQGEIVAMTGDGVNDAPALKAADIGVAMGTGTDVAKEAADLILTDDNFATIIAAVEEGRSVFENIRNFLRFLLSSNAGEVLTVFFGVVLAKPLGLGGEGTVVLPLLATQILWLNLVTDGPPALALGLDPAAPDLMTRQPRPRSEGVTTKRMRLTIGFVGIVMAIGTLLIFDAALPGGWIEGNGTINYGRTMAFTTLMLFQLFNAFNCRSEVSSAFTGLFSNLWLWGAVSLSLALHFLIIYTPFLQAALGTESLAPSDWFRCTLAASSVLWTVELAKFFFRHFARQKTSA